MYEFAQLFIELDQTNSTNQKVKSLSKYFATADENDKIWALALLSGRRPKRSVSTALLRTWAAEIAGIPYWLFEESYHTVGDLAETIAMLVKQTGVSVKKPLHIWMFELNLLSKKEEDEKKDYILNAWQHLDTNQRFVFNKLLTGGFRVGVSQKLVEKSLSAYYNIDANAIAHRLMGNWTPTNTTFDELLFSHSQLDDASKPYPFFLAHPLQDEPEQLGNVNEWFAEWKWDGIRSQIIVRNGELFIWSRGEELVTQKFPELHELSKLLPSGTVLDAELIAFNQNGILPFQLLQTRISRKNVSKKHLNEAPAALIAYDIFEHNGLDIRNLTHKERRVILERIIQEANSPELMISELIQFDQWDQLSEIRLTAREKFAEGLMVKRKSATYQSGRKRGDWWKWKLDPYSIDAVMIYGMKGHGRRANLYTDYTFAVWDGEMLVPFTKAYSGLTDAEILQVDTFIKANTLERFGPVRSVKAELVFEIGFEGIQESSRHKSGIALRFPRILRWRQDKMAAEANSLQDLKDLLSSV